MTAQAISDKLTQSGHQVTMKTALDIKPEDATSAQLLLLGSPSWDYEGQEGMPHEDYVQLMEKLKSLGLENKPFAIFGLGDSSYRHFCGAVDHLEEFVNSLKGKLVVPSLRIDNFFADQLKHMESINTWAESLAEKLTITT